MRQDGGHRLIARRSPALFLAVGLAVSPETAIAPASVSADFDGDGTVETVTAAPSSRGIRIHVADARGRRIAEARAPSPAGDVVPFTLTTASVGSAGALLEVAASTDTSECVSVWRLRDRALARVPIREASGRALPDCEPPGWSWRWESTAGKPSELVRERTQKVDGGTLVTREAFTFAGFSLDAAAARSGAEINGVPIPAWFPETLLTRAALETLYSRFGLDAMRKEPELSIVTDAVRGVFALRFRVPSSGAELVAPVDSYAVSGADATLGARAGEKTAHVTLRLSGSGLSVPLDVRVEGLGAPYDQRYAPAGSWRGGARQVFLSAADEVASEQLAGIWISSKGQRTSMEVEGEGPYRIRSGSSVLVPDLAAAAPPVDLLLRPAAGSGEGWAVTLRGPNAMDLTACRFESAGSPCASVGSPETLRRVGALVNMR